MCGPISTKFGLLPPFVALFKVRNYISRHRQQRKIGITSFTFFSRYLPFGIHVLFLSKILCPRIIRSSQKIQISKIFTNQKIKNRIQMVRNIKTNMKLAMPNFRWPLVLIVFIEWSYKMWHHTEFGQDNSSRLVPFSSFYKIVVIFQQYYESG